MRKKKRKSVKRHTFGGRFSKYYKLGRTEHYVFTFSMKANTYLDAF